LASTGKEFARGGPYGNFWGWNNSLEQHLMELEESSERQVTFRRERSTIRFGLKSIRIQDQKLIYKSSKEGSRNLSTLTMKEQFWCMRKEAPEGHLLNLSGIPT
jgi:hypothetical protein